MAKGVITALIIFVVGIALNLPSEANIGVIILSSLKSVICDSQTGVIAVCNTLKFGIVAIRILGVGLIVGDILYIVTQIKKGNFY